jgi:hypothetical protein
VARKSYCTPFIVKSFFASYLSLYQAIGNRILGGALVLGYFGNIRDHYCDVYAVDLLHPFHLGISLQS